MSRAPATGATVGSVQILHRGSPGERGMMASGPAAVSEATRPSLSSNTPLGLLYGEGVVENLVGVEGHRR